MSDERIRELERSAQSGDPSAVAALAAERDRSEGPAAKRARLRAEKAAAEQVVVAARAALFDLAVEAELDLRAGGPGQDQAVLAATELAVRERERHAAAAHGSQSTCSNDTPERAAERSEAAARDYMDRQVEAALRAVPGRVRIALLAARDYAAATPGLPARVRDLIAESGFATGSGAVTVDPSRKGYWLRQNGEFVRDRADLSTGAYAFGESGKSRRTQRGAILAVVHGSTAPLYLDIATAAETSVPAAVAAVRLALVDITTEADRREALEARTPDGH